MEISEVTKMLSESNEAATNLIADHARLREINAELVAALEKIAEWPHSGSLEYQKGEQNPNGYYANAFYLMEAEITKARDIARSALAKAKS